MAAPTREVLKVEVEHGPLAAELAPFWADVFEVHPKPEMAWFGLPHEKRTRS